MRDIKFRVWDKALKKYMTLKEYQNLHAIEVETDGTLILSPRYRFMGSMMIQVDAFDVQQYTGLHDKNGKEIYEGDKVYIIPEDNYGEIKWDSDMARFVVIYDDLITDFDNWYGYDLEVVGTIYD